MWSPRRNDYGREKKKKKGVSQEEDKEEEEEEEEERRVSAQRCRRVGVPYKLVLMSRDVVPLCNGPLHGVWSVGWEAQGRGVSGSGDKGWRQLGRRLDLCGREWTCGCVGESEREREHKRAGALRSLFVAVLPGNQREIMRIM